MEERCKFHSFAAALPHAIVLLSMTSMTMTMKQFVIRAMSVFRIVLFARRMLKHSMPFSEKTHE